MAEWHLKELRNAIERSGWRFVAEHAGDGYRISATWEFERDVSERHILVCFEGLDDLRTLPIQESYGCHVQDVPGATLYFGRKGRKNSTRRDAWVTDLRSFTTALENRDEG
jgi:hypothetical protein